MYIISFVIDSCIVVSRMFFNGITLSHLFKNTSATHSMLIALINLRRFLTTFNEILWNVDGMNYIQTMNF